MKLSSLFGLCVLRYSSYKEFGYCIICCHTSFRDCKCFHRAHPLDLKKMATGREGGGASLRLPSSHAGRVGTSREWARGVGPIGWGGATKCWAEPERGRGRVCYSAGVCRGERRRRGSPLDARSRERDQDQRQPRSRAEAGGTRVRPESEFGRREAPGIGEAPGAARRRLPYPRGRGDGHGARRQSARPRPGLQTSGPGSSSPRAASPAVGAAPPPPVQTAPAPLRSRVSAPRPPLQTRVTHLAARGCWSPGSGRAASEPPPGEDAGGAGVTSWKPAPAAAVVRVAAGSRAPGSVARSREGAAAGWAP